MEKLRITFDIFCDLPDGDPNKRYFMRSKGGFGNVPVNQVGELTHVTSFCMSKPNGLLMKVHDLLRRSKGATAEAVRKKVEKIMGIV